jgi:hypothetical protein
MKCYKAVVYILDFEGHPAGDIIYELEKNKHINAHVDEFQVAFIGEWDDNHPLNQRGCDYEIYAFKDVV